MNSRVSGDWEREVMWRRDDGGIEHAHLHVADGGGDVEVDGVAVWRGGDAWPGLGAAAGDGAGGLHRVRYRLRCDASWRVREVRVEAPEDGTVLLLNADGEGHWRDGEGARLPAIDGCIDVDLYAIAFTNTLPVRRLHMAVGEVRDIEVAFVVLPGMEVRRAAQRYTRVSDNLYRYESVGSGFVADLLVDEDGLVARYPGLAQRMWAR